MLKNILALVEKARNLDNSLVDKKEIKRSNALSLKLTGTQTKDSTKNPK